MSSAEVARIGLRLRVKDCCSQAFDCSRNVTPESCFTTSLKYSVESAPLAWIISLAFRLHSLLESSPGPEIGQMRSRTCIRLSCPGMSFQNRTTNHLPDFSI